MIEMQRKMEWISGTAYLLGGLIPAKTSDSRNGAQIQDSRSQLYAWLIDSAYDVFLDIRIIVIKYGAYTNLAAS